MRILRYFVRLVGLGCLTGVFAAAFIAQEFPRWWVVFIVAALQMALSMFGLVMLIASFMPQIKNAKRAAQAVQAGSRAPSLDHVKCLECDLLSVCYCFTHAGALCLAHGNAHRVAGCTMWPEGPKPAARSVGAP